MSSEASVVPNAAVNIPDVIITEPSPGVQNPSEISPFIQEKAAPPIGPVPEPSETLAGAVTKDSVPEQTTSASEQEKDSSSEFSPAEDGIDCVVSVPEVSDSEQAEPTTGSSLSDPDEFRTYGCCHFNVNCDGAYEYLWNIIVSRYAIPFWLLAMSLPISAGIMGAIYMFECPAVESLPNMIFMIGISLMAVFTLRVCLIVHRSTWADENSRSMLQTMHMICLFITLLFFITESVTYWQMNSSTGSLEDNLCHPTFSNYLYWWNIAMTVFMSFVLLFPIA